MNTEAVAAQDWHSLTGREVVVPGSTSNLGPGFDALGLALQVNLRLTIVEVRDDGKGATEWHFAGAPLQGDNAIERGYRQGLRGFGRTPSVPSLSVQVRSDIPMRAGLGSSAAALVAGLRLADLVAGRQPTERLLASAAALEGHPDNTSASVLGGFVVATRFEDGTVVARATPWPSQWVIVIATPALGLETKVARAALPATYPLADAVHNIQRVALLVDAVHRVDPIALARALSDKLHQPYRASLVPGLADALAWPAVDGFLGAFLSGAGPSIAALVDSGVPDAVPQTVGRFETLYKRLALRVAVRALRAHPVLDSVAALDGKG